MLSNETIEGVILKKKLLFSVTLCIVVLSFAYFVHQPTPKTIGEAVDLTVGFKMATLCCFEDYEGIQKLTGTDLDVFVDWIGNISIFSSPDNTPKRLGDYSLLLICEDDPSKHIQIEVFDTYVYIIDTDENEYYYGVDATFKEELSSIFYSEKT